MLLLHLNRVALVHPRESMSCKYRWDNLFYCYCMVRSWFKLATKSRWKDVLYSLRPAGTGACTGREASGLICWRLTTGVPRNKTKDCLSSIHYQTCQYQHTGCCKLAGAKIAAHSICTDAANSHYLCYICGKWHLKLACQYKDSPLIEMNPSFLIYLAAFGTSHQSY